MGGQDGNRGYLLQAIIAVLQSLTNTSWVNISIEPDENNQKVDIQCWDADGNETVTQVKSSISNFDKAEILKIAAELIKDMPDAEQYILTLIGTYSGETVKFFNSLKTQEKTAFGAYNIVFDLRDKVITELKALDIAALDGLAESRIHAFLSLQNYIVPHQVINLIALGLQAQFSRFATNGEKISRNKLEEQIITWMKFNYPKELRRDNERLELCFYYDHKLDAQNSFSYQLKLPNNVLKYQVSERKSELFRLIEQIQAIKLPQTKRDIEENGRSSSFYSIFEPYGRLSAAFDDEEIEKMNLLTLELLNVTLPDDFFQVGQVKKIEMTTATLFIGGGPKFTGTEEEKSKREALSNFSYQLDLLKDLITCRDALCTFRVLPIVITNVGDTLQTNIELQLRVPKDLHVLTDKTFPRPEYNQNMEVWGYDEGIAQGLFIMPQTSTVQAYNYRKMVPINFPDILPYFGRQYQQSMEQNLKWVFDYNVYCDEPGITTLSCLFKSLQPKSAMALPSYIFIKSDQAFEISYRIRSDQSGNSEGNLKIL